MLQVESKASEKICKRYNIKSRVHFISFSSFVSLTYRLYLGKKAATKLSRVIANSHSNYVKLVNLQLNHLKTSTAELLLKTLKFSVNIDALMLHS